MKKSFLIFFSILVISIVSGMVMANNKLEIIIDGRSFEVEALVDFIDLSNKNNEKEIKLAIDNEKNVFSGFSIEKGRGLTVQDKMTDSYDLYPNILKLNGFDVKDLNSNMYMM
ncbi:MAG: hypothetical protein J6C46_03010 [Clostridia bacterium]|nr:hypothetical protein [Clostridia bacterium]